MRSVNEDFTAMARIRQTAIERFPVDGASATLRAIAAAAGVSPALVLHHFGSKEGLIRACDHYVVETIRGVKGEAIEEGTMSDPGFLAAAFRIAPPIMRYLGWALAQGTQAAADLYDEMVDETAHLLALAEKQGMVKASAHPRERAAVMTSMQLGLIVLHDHLSRATGTDVFEAEGLITLSQVSLEIMSGLFADSTADATAAALDQAAQGMRKEGDHG